MEKNKIVMIIAIVEAVVIVVGALVLLVVFSTSDVVKKTDGQKVVAIPNVCDGDITNYNTILETYGASGNQTPEQLEGVISTIKAREGYEQDPSCLYMVIRHYLMKRDFLAIDPVMSQYKELNKQGLYASGAITGVQHAEALDGTVKGMRMLMNEAAPVSEK